MPDWDQRAVPQTRGRRALRHAGRGARFFLLAAVPFVVLIGLAVALTFVRLKHGPISLSFLVAPIEQSINAVLKGYVARVDDAIVRLTDGSRLEFRLQNIRFAEADGDIVASAPLAAIEISRHGLLEGQLVPSRVELIRPELYLTYGRKTGLGVSFSALPEGTRPDERLAKTPDGLAGSAGAGSGDDNAGEAGTALLKKLDFSELVARVSSQARGAGRAASFLREFGVRDAILTVDNQGHRTVWQLPELNIDFDRREAQSVISGRARVASGNGSWRLAFHTEDTAGQTTLRASVRDVVPATLFDGVEGGSLMGHVDLPVGADITLALSPQGGIRTADLDLGLGQGRVILHDRAGREEPIPVQAGRIKLRYDPAAGTMNIGPSTLQAGGSTMTFQGRAASGNFEGEDGWGFELASVDGLLGSGDFAAAPLVLESFTAQGRYLPAREFIKVDKVEIKAGGAALVADAEFSFGEGRSGARFAGRGGAASIAAAKAAWPRGLAPKSRQWVGEHVNSGEVKRFEFKRETGVYAPQAEGAPATGRLSLVVEAGETFVKPTDQLPVVRVPRALVTIENDLLEVSVPEGEMALPSGKPITFKGGRLTSPNILAEPSDAQFEFKALGGVEAFLEVLQQPPISLVDGRSIPFKSIEGKVEAQMALAFPMKKGLSLAQIKTNGKAKLKDGRIQKLLGEYDVQGASVAFDFTNGAVEAAGEAIVRGVLARISWQHIFDAPEERQPPLRITATLDNADRRQLGLDLSHMLTGEVPVDLQVVRGTAPGERKVHVRADLSNADISLPSIAWRKPPGRSAFAEFDIAQVAENKQELQNFRVAGDNIAIEGWAALGADKKLAEFFFPDFSINVVTRLKVQGTRREDDVWDIKARGTTFDGKDFFRSLFTVGRDGEASGGSASGGVDLDAQIDNVLGYSDMSLRALKLKLKTRGGKLADLEARGTLDGGAPIAVVLDRDKQGQRRIRADSTDAGQAFKLVGFYPNMQSGRVRLEVNVDGRGAADKAGTLWVEDFRVLGDPVVSEVVSSGLDDGRPSITGNKRVTREVFVFDTMQVPFSLGHGQFVLDDAYVKGPLLGASIRGKVDFKTSRVNLGGTYIPLQGLNNAFGQIPVLGQILSGPRGEGIFGITFAITGAMANPQVIVNPLSLVAPGIFREIFQMTNPSPKVQPRGTEAVSKRRRSREKDAPVVAPGTTIDGWSSETKKK